MIQRGERLEVQKAMLAYLGQQLQPWAFDPKPSGQDFYQRRPNGLWAFHISFIPHKDDVDLTANVAVRLHEIENLVNKYDSRRTPAEQKKSMTFGGELGNISQGRPLRWTLDEVEDIPAVGDAVIEAFDRIGWPFLEKHSDLESARLVLTSEEPGDVLLAPILGPRYMRAVASIRLLGDDQKLKTLVPAYEAKLRESDDLYLEDFRALCRSIGDVQS